MGRNDTYNQAPFQHALLQAIAVNAPEFIAVMKQDGLRIIYVNESGAKLFGYKNAHSLINKKSPFVRNQSLSPKELKNVYKKIETEGIYSAEVQYLNKNKKPFWGKLQVNAFGAGQEKYLLVQIEKIDRAIIAEERLIKEKNRFGALLNYASIAVVIVNETRDIILMNPFALKLFGYKLTEIIGKKIETLIPEASRKKHIRQHKKYFESPANREMAPGRELLALKKDGSKIPVEISLGTYNTENEIYVISYISDISVRKQREEEIKKLNTELEKKIELRTKELDIIVRKLEQKVKETEDADTELKKLLSREKELNQLKSRFVSIASHEFRTPLSTILSSAFLLQKYIHSEDQPKRDKHIERITSSVNLLTDILNDFLDVGKIEEGKVTLNFSQVEICLKTNETITELKSILKKGQTITCHQKGNIIAWLDPTIFMHILMNLLSNASKFSPENTAIEITIQKKRHYLQLVIKDNGIGIPKEDQQHLFERFFRASNVANIQGTGLGLHIVKKYVELMGGSIQCLSELEKGTSFIINFPLKDKSAQ